VKKEMIQGVKRIAERRRVEIPEMMKESAGGDDDRELRST
jgi:hypothetical protein